MAQRQGLLLAEAQQRAQEAIKALRYGSNDYFWINGQRPAMVMHPFNPGMHGKDSSTYTEPNGKKLFNEMVAVCKQSGAGFAVVTDEVRNLAMRAAEAARSTAGLIDGTVAEVRDSSGESISHSAAGSPPADPAGGWGVV